MNKVIDLFGAGEDLLTMRKAWSCEVEGDCVAGGLCHLNDLVSVDNVGLLERGDDADKPHYQ